VEEVNMATNPMGKGTKIIGINMKLPMARELEKRASSLGISTGAYCKIVIRRHLDSDAKITLSDSSKGSQGFSATSPNYPSSRTEGHILRLTKGELYDIKKRGLHSTSNNPDVASNTTKILRSKTKDGFQKSSEAKLKWWKITLFLIVIILALFYLDI
tara:strand:+ start:275 stop:748 length:474 start_codon:yes stop_codon:yes gene_type:complete